MRGRRRDQMGEALEGDRGRHRCRFSATASAERSGIWPSHDSDPKSSYCEHMFCMRYFYDGMVACDVNRPTAVFRGGQHGRRGEPRDLVGSLQNAALRSWRSWPRHPGRHDADRDGGGSRADPRRRTPLPADAGRDRLCRAGRPPLFAVAAPARPRPQWLDGDLALDLRRAAYAGGGGGS